MLLILFVNSLPQIDPTAASQVEVISGVEIAGVAAALVSFIPVFSAIIKWRADVDLANINNAGKRLKERSQELKETLQIVNQYKAEAVLLNSKTEELQNVLREIYFRAQAAATQTRNVYLPTSGKEELLRGLREKSSPLVQQLIDEYVQQEQFIAGCQQQMQQIFRLADREDF